MRLALAQSIKSCNNLRTTRDALQRTNRSALSPAELENLDRNLSSLNSMIASNESRQVGLKKLIGDSTP